MFKSGVNELFRRCAGGLRRSCRGMEGLRVRALYAQFGLAAGPHRHRASLGNLPGQHLSRMLRQRIGAWG